MTPVSSVTWHSFKEPLRVTLARTLTIAVVVGVVFAWLSRGSIGLPLAILLALWPSLGGHVVEVFFLNQIRPRLSAARLPQMTARIGLWFLAGVVLLLCMRLTAALAGFHPPGWSAWWVGGIAFIGIELVPHLFLQLRGRPSF
ncbi:MAG TPA: hypothetical protein VN541_14625 [Tepidisphaeraceae bacterium]|nr:hypothetical protein [Tepidisphaeraceae bacterium]